MTGTTSEPAEPVRGPGGGGPAPMTLSHLVQVSRACGLADELRRALAPLAHRRAVHHPGDVVVRLALAIALGGRCRPDPDLLREAALAGPPCSSSTLGRVLRALAARPDVSLPALREARALARARVYAHCRPGLSGSGDASPGRPPLALDLAAVADSSRSARTVRAARAGGTVWASLDHGPGLGCEALDAVPQSPGSGYLRAVDLALAQLPAAARPRVFVRAGVEAATTEVLVGLARRGLPFSVELPVSAALAEAAAALPRQAWRVDLQPGEIDDSPDEVAELTGRVTVVDLPATTRIIARRPRAHAQPGELNCLATTITEPDILRLERQHRRHARCVQQLRTLADTGLTDMPAESDRTAVWAQVVAVATDLLTWTDLLTVDEKHADAEGPAPRAGGRRRVPSRRGSRSSRHGRPRNTSVTVGVALVATGTLLAASAVGLALTTRTGTLAAASVVAGRTAVSATAPLPPGFAPVGTSAPGAAPASVPSPPVEVAIPVISVRSSLVGLRLNGDGTLQVPTDFARAGWYSQGSMPGEAGRPAVIVGHVDSYRGPAVFYRLRDLHAGDTVLVRRADGVTLRFTVYRTAVYSKDRFPTDSVYAATVHPELRLITCAGVFDRSNRHYLSNEVIYARQQAAPVPAPALTRPSDAGPSQERHVS